MGGTGGQVDGKNGVFLCLPSDFIDRNNYSEYEIVTKKSVTNSHLSF